MLSNNSVRPKISTKPKSVPVEELLHLFQQDEKAKNHLFLCVVQTSSENCGLEKNVSTVKFLILSIKYKFPHLCICI